MEYTNIALGFCVYDDSIIGNFGIDIIKKDLESANKGFIVTKFTQNNFDGIKDYPIIGFSLYYGSHIWNLRKNIQSIKDRDNKLIFTGGITSYAPQALTPLVDIVFVGDGEEVVRKVVEIYTSMKNKSIPKPDIMRFIDSLHLDGVLVSNITKRVTPNYYTGITTADSNNIFTKGNLIECGKGCPFSCNFCMVSHTSKPFRPAKLSSIKTSIKNMEYKSVLPFSLDFNNLPFHRDIIDTCIQENKHISLSSARLDKVNQGYVGLLKKAGLTRITTSVETYDQSLLKAYNKGLKHDEILPKLRLLAENFEGLKIYMIGNNSREDKDKTIDFLFEIDEIAGETQCNIDVSFSWFEPKPHTPLQYEGLFLEGFGDYEEYEFPNINIVPPQLTVYMLIDYITCFGNKNDIEYLYNIVDKHDYYISSRFYEEDDSNLKQLKKELLEYYVPKGLFREKDINTKFDYECIELNSTTNIRNKYKQYLECLS